MATPIQVVRVLTTVIPFAFTVGLPLRSVGEETVYKSVDAEGNITYSSTPPIEAVETKPLAVPEGPSEADRQEALAREQALQQRTDTLKRDLETRREQKSATVGDAEERLAKAKNKLEAARVQQPDDWQPTGRGRFLKESYHERVREAEELVRQAEKELAKARRDSR